jgi:hypothetical protein
VTTSSPRGAAKPKGTVQIGIHIGGITYAARMSERGVTATSNACASFHSAPSALFHGTLDIVHAEHELVAGWMVSGVNMALEFALFYIYGVLRPGAWSGSTTSASPTRS